MAPSAMGDIGARSLRASMVPQSAESGNNKVLLLYFLNKIRFAPDAFKVCIVSFASFLGTDCHGD